MQASATPSHPVVVLTGASSGIGHATALAFARRGAALVLASRGQEGLDAVADACRKRGAQVIVVPTDVTDGAAVQALADAAIARFGHIDVWVNNVGVGVVGLFDQVPLEAHRRVVEANLMGHMNGAHAALRHFRQRRSGTLINMISVGGLAATPYAAAYVASKFALRGFSQSLRAEMSALQDVHVCEVYPTFVDTPGLQHGANHTGRSIKPPRPLLDPRTVADTIVSLADRPRASVSLGSAAVPARLAHAVAPDTVGRLARVVVEAALKRADPAPVTDGNLFAPSQGTAIDGGYRQGKPLAERLRSLPGVRALADMPGVTTAGLVGAGLVTAAATLGWLALRARRL